MAAVERGLKLSPTDPSLHLVAAKCERRDGQLESAIHRLEQLNKKRNV